MASSGGQATASASAAKPATEKEASPPAPVNVQINSELEWLRFREETLGPAAYSEAAGSKLLRKMSENPLVPAGALVTLGALTYGLWCFRQGRARDSQVMMRARIGAQGFTIVAILGGILFGGSQDHKTRPTDVK